MITNASLVEPLSIFFFASVMRDAADGGMATDGIVGATAGVSTVPVADAAMVAVADSEVLTAIFAVVATLRVAATGCSTFGETATGIDGSMASDEGYASNFAVTAVNFSAAAIFVSRSGRRATMRSNFTFSSARRSVVCCAASTSVPMF